MFDKKVYYAYIIRITICSATMGKKCINCGDYFEGRENKKFCNVYCKSAYQYKLKKTSKSDFYTYIDKQLKTNRRILKAYNKAGKAIVRCQTIVEEGFNPKIFTHYWKNQNGEVYLFVYEFGFLRKTENNTEKFVLVQWQQYMEKYLIPS